MKRIDINPYFFYYISGNDPKLLVHTGTHGDEWEVAGLVENYLKTNEKILPDFVFVPEVSPSAVKNKTRQNNLKNDLNRCFFSDSNDPEVQANIEILKNRNFDLMLSFHEDPDFPEYYIYDVGLENTTDELILEHNRLLSSKGIELLNGVDDPNDINLGYEFREGYRKFVHKIEEDDGMISSWVFNRKIIKEYLLPEIPGKANLETKKYIVESFFEEVVLKMVLE